MDQFNKISKDITTCQLFQEMSRLVCLYSSNLLKAKIILAAENDLRTLSLDSGGLVLDENLGIVNNTWVLLHSYKNLIQSHYIVLLGSFVYLTSRSQKVLL